jgi:hypothetical protein
MTAATPFRRVARLAWALPAALLLLLAAPPASAEVIHLRTGEALKGRPIQEQSNEDYLTIEDYLTGITRRLSWNVVDPADREELWANWNWTNRSQAIVKGHRIVLNLSGGETEELLGLIVREDAEAHYVMRNGEELRVPKAQVAGVEDNVDLDAREIWNADQLYQRQVQAMKDEGVDFSSLSARDHWRLGQFADWAEAYEQAREHYAAAAADPEFLKREIASQRLERVESLLRDQAALAALRDARLKLHMNLFGKVRGLIDEFAAAHPDMSPAVSQTLERLRSDFTQKRTAYLQEQAARYFIKDVERLITQKVKEKDVALTDATAWTRRELPDAAFAKVAERMKRWDEVTPEDARAFWDGRPKRPWRRVTYGSGTFIVDPPKLKPPQRRTSPQRNSGSSRPSGGAAPKVEIPKPPNRDQWWEKANTTDRTNWVFAYFVERSDLFEVSDRDYRPCQICQGSGLLSKTLQNGETLEYLCTRCGGAQRDVIVKFR